MERNFRVNAGTVVFENYESESLAINLKTGTYYSLTGPASRLWKLLDSGTASAGIIDFFVALHAGDREHIAARVRRFLEDLETEQLVVEDCAVHANGAAPAPVASGSTPFEDFRMRVYTDMQDLLLLDPIHDTDESGWPSVQG